jgi:hypothetical protein
VIQFRNSRFEDDETAWQVIGDMENPQIGTAYVISLDPHPNLVPHPYVEWFSLRKNHYRFELNAGDAWIVPAGELAAIDQESRKIREALSGHTAERLKPRDESDWI